MPFDNRTYDGFWFSQRAEASLSAYPVCRQCCYGSHSAYGFVDLAQSGGDDSTGDVIVVDMSGDTERACWGEIVNYAARVKKVEGVVIGGCITDFQPLLEQRVPIFSLGISPLTTRILGIEGELNTVISVCGVSVYPGDLVVADDDGVFVVNPSAAVDYAIRALKKQESEIETKRKLDAGISLASISGSQRFFE